MSLSTPKTEPHSPALAGVGFWSALLCAYGLLVLFSLLRVPIPGVNEPHYLCKAKHFWDPSWCSRDIFLTSSNPHLVFYATFGWLTKYFSLDTTAVMARVIGLVPLAVGWHLLCVRLSQSAWTSVVSLSIFFVLQSAGNWSGEWLVGGIESKVIAYGLLFWAISQVIILRFPSSALLAGLAISFHPVVGVWGTLATVMATFGFVLLSDKENIRKNVPGVKVWGLSMFLFLVAASPGLISAGMAVLNDDQEASRIATVLQVGHRLSHHLDPMKFPKVAYRYFAAMIFVWILFIPKREVRESDRWWNLLILSSLIIAACGVWIGWGPRPIKEMPGYVWRISALKFYPFRLADLMVPVALSIAVGKSFLSWIKKKFASPAKQTGSVICCTLLLTWSGLVIPGSEQNPSKMSVSKRQNWIEACQWIDDNTEKSALVYSFGNQWAVKWYCDRAEYVNYKDCPQDAKSIIAWNRRRWAIVLWKKQSFLDGRISSEELQELTKITEATIFICERLGPIDQKPDFQNSDFRVYVTGTDSSLAE
ncbi:DUF6798 domain-containing protein [Thalassoglobus polymorphus]|uniref:DUF6798 domain-containing protein n=1 Tax=Thalassoglobus polymorphus TaxID=2527994 RepID=A0A517QU14_9PLAN|nr:DUF6798 domain-containing protein [Thalassoglobus polymorphus]QDT35102.1 hypothetical protein Mal48_43770 [Thalassoglobus polymorphus]